MKIWSDLADKYKVRSFLNEKGLSRYLVRLYGVYSNMDNIDFERLPDSFVLKLNHGCGDIVFCRNQKEKMDIASNLKLRNSINQKLKVRYGLNTGELHYQNINPLIIVEELLPVDKQDFPSSSMVDYKFWCINGRVESCMVIFNRHKFDAEIALYDREWNNINFNLQSDSHVTVTHSNIPRPRYLTEMIELSEALSTDHPQVRVDLYYTNNQIYFGELTFTSLAGLMTYFTPEYLIYLGDKISEGKLFLKCLRQ